MTIAYLDPGSGAVLVNLIIAGLAALFYFFKDLFLRLFGKNRNNKKSTINHGKLAILSEGKQYWGTFKPIISELIRLEVPFRYYTLDVEDPALLIENEFMDSKFLGYGILAQTKVSHISTDYLLSTTPNIGNKNYYIKKPQKTVKMVHVFHSINDISMYKSGSLDFYDSVILAGDFQIESIREIEKKRNLEEKELIPLGLPYLDELLIEKKVIRKDVSSKKTILIASSWGAKGCLKNYGTDFIKNLSKLGYEIIVRPHPQSLLVEEKFIKKVEAELVQLPNVEWDDKISPSESLNRADLLISDTSSIRFDFAFIYEKPVITLEIELEEMKGFERDYLDSLWTDSSSHEIGFVIDKKSVDTLPSLIEKAMVEYDADRIREIREKTVVNFGKGGNAIAEYFETEIQEST